MFFRRRRSRADVRSSKQAATALVVGSENQIDKALAFSLSEQVSVAIVSYKGQSQANADNADRNVDLISDKRSAVPAHVNRAACPTFSRSLTDEDTGITIRTPSSSPGDMPVFVEDGITVFPRSAADAARNASSTHDSSRRDSAERPHTPSEPNNLDLLCGAGVKIGRNPIDKWLAVQTAQYR